MAHRRIWNSGYHERKAGSGSPAHNALARIGPAATLPGREPRDTADLHRWPKTHMPRDIDIVIERVRALHPDAKIEQLKVRYPVDDDGLWIFGIDGKPEDIQVESNTGAAPFLIEHTDMKKSEEAIVGASVDQAVREVSAYLDVLKSQAGLRSEVRQ